MNRLLKIDFHCHTEYSKDSLDSLESVLKTARRKQIDRLVITDHNTIRGAQKASRIDPELVIVGEEIATLKGELLAIFVKEEVPKNLHPLEAIRRLRDQDAFISVSHPFDLRRRGWQLLDLIEIAPLIDAVEIFNSRCINMQINDQAKYFALEHQLGGTAGSDAHTLYEIGRATLLLPFFDNSGELRDVIKQGKVDGRLTTGPLLMATLFNQIMKKIRASNQNKKGGYDRTTN